MAKAHALLYALAEVQFDMIWLSHKISFLVPASGQCALMCAPSLLTSLCSGLTHCQVLGLRSHTRKLAQHSEGFDNCIKAQLTLLVTQGISFQSALSPCMDAPGFSTAAASDAGVPGEASADSKGLQPFCLSYFNPRFSCFHLASSRSK